MTSPIQTQKILSRIKVLPQVGGDASTEKKLTLVDLRDYFGVAIVLCVAAVKTAGTTGLTAFKLIANTAAGGGGTNVVVKQHALATLPKHAGDVVCLEATAEEIKALGDAAGVELRYVGAMITCADAADNVVANLVLFPARNPIPDLTADSVS